MMLRCTMEGQINFKLNMTKNNLFSEEFLASALSISILSLHKTTTLLVNKGEIMVYGKEDLREYKIEDVYVILTKYSNKEQVKVLDQFKKEFFHG